MEGGFTEGTAVCKVFLGHTWASLVAQMVESACSVGDTGLIPGLGRSPEERNGSLLQSSCLGNPMHKEAWWVGYRTYLFP